MYTRLTCDSFAVYFYLQRESHDNLHIKIAFDECLLYNKDEMEL